MDNVEQCPICGISPPRVLDHYLPKSVFDPLAIYVRNLIPLCVECNSHKGAAAPTSPEQRFLHAYFETLPQIRFLVATVAIQGAGLIVDFDVDPQAALDDIIHQRLTYQLARLRLKERQAKEINTYLVGHISAMHAFYDAGGAASLRRRELLADCGYRSL